MHGALDAVGDWVCPGLSGKPLTTAPVRFNENGTIDCMSNDGTTCILGDATQCTALVASPADGTPAPVCNATQMRDAANAFCYKASQALLPFPLDNCEPPGC